MSTFAKNDLQLTYSLELFILMHEHRKIFLEILSSQLATGNDSVKWLQMRGGGAGVETQKNVRGEIGGWGRVPLNETYAPLLSTIYDGA